MGETIGHKWYNKIFSLGTLESVNSKEDGKVFKCEESGCLRNKNLYFPIEFCAVSLASTKQKATLTFEWISGSGASECKSSLM